MSEKKKAEKMTKIFLTEKHPQSLESYLKTIKIHEDSGDKDKIVQSYFDVGIKYSSLYDCRKALEYFFLSYNATSKKENYELHIKSSVYIGKMFSNIGNYEKALKVLFNALKYYKLKSDDLNIAKVYFSIADCYNGTKELEKALNYNLKSLNVYESINDEIKIAQAMGEVAINYYLQANYDAALEYLLKALIIQKKSKYYFGIGVTQNNIGEIYYKLEKFEDSLKYCLCALESNKDVEEKYVRLTIYLNLGKVYKKLKKNEKALENLNKALKISEDMKMKNNQPEILQEIKEIYFDLGEIRKAYEVQEKYVKLKNDILVEKEKIRNEDFQKEQFSNIGSKLTNEKTNDNQIIGTSEEMKEVFSLIDIISEHNVNVLITGPTGSGKELVADKIHQNFKTDSPFVAINCSAIPEHLLESELFGHTKGAFTGAIKNKQGKIEQASGGTLFLDEIGDMNLSLQAKILRVLQERKVTPIGSTKEIPVSVRIISATNKNLEELIETGQFRVDLFYRLNVIRIKIPALKDHKSDIPALVSHFIQKCNKKFDKNIKDISVNALNYLISCEWPGNVRELENEIEKAVLLSKEDIIKFEILTQFNDENDSCFSEILPLVWDEYKSYKNKLGDKLDLNYVAALMESTNNVIQKASETGNLSRMQIYRLLKKSKT